MRGNSHVRFLGGNSPVMGCSYPITLRMYASRSPKRTHKYVLVTGNRTRIDSKEACFHYTITLKFITSKERNRQYERVTSLCLQCFMII